MARVRPEVDLGRSILTPQPSRQKFTAKRTGNLLPKGHSLSDNTAATSTNTQQHVESTATRSCNHWAANVGETMTTSSTSNDRPPYVAPTAKMESSQARQDREARLAYTGKGKGRATSPVSKEAPSPVAGNDDTAEPLLTSDVLMDSQQKALEDAKRYQEQVDRYESRRDREDTDFLDPGTQEDDSQTQKDIFESPRRRSRRIASDSVMSLLQDSAPQHPAQAAQPNASKKTPAKQKQLPIQQKPVEQTSAQRTPVQAVQQMPVQKTLAQQMQPAREQQLPESRKRKADDEIASEQPRLSPIARAATLPNSPTLPTKDSRPEQKPRISHNNRRYELCKSESQMRRKDAVRAIKKLWGITEDQLMSLPHAPRIASKREERVMKPLNWNTKLLEAVAHLANVTKRDFPKACIVADEAFEKVGRPCGAKQLTDEILSSALVPQHSGSGGAEASTGITSAQQPGSDRRRSAPSAPSVPSGVSIETPAIEGRQSLDNIVVSGQIPSRPSLIVKLPVNAPSLPLPATSPVAASSSPAAAPIKSEQVVPIMLQEGLGDDDGESLGDEERLNLESRRQILEHQLAIVQLKLGIDDRRRKKEREGKAARARQPGSSVHKPLLV